MNLNQTPNLNLLWARLMVEELIRCGADYFCLAPGSRSGPLAVAVAENKKARSFVHFDERGLGFHALGYTAATQKPVVVITTSGTAVANLLPAVVEAAKKKLPLIILTADRPPELRKTGANQTIEQVNIFGEYVRYHLDWPCPSLDIPAEFVLTTIDQAVYRAAQNLKGPVHLNCMLREPLAPVKTTQNFTAYLSSLTSWLKGTQPFTRYLRSQKTLNAPALNAVSQTMKAAWQGIIAVGKLASEKDQAAVLNLAKHLAWPVFADATSGLRLGNKHPNLIPHYDQILLNDKIFQKMKIDCVLQLGGRMTSRRFSELLEKTRPVPYIMVLNHPLRNDPTHQVSLRLECSATEFCRKMIPQLPQRRDTRYLKQWQTMSTVVKDEIDDYLTPGTEICEPSATRIISRLLPKGSTLFLANSMPIREADMYAAEDGQPVIVAANRGASGIDGILASAIGFAKGSNRPTTLITGDLALLHDLNSLAMIKTLDRPFVAIVFNNNGGAIFNFLPIAKFAKVFEKYFAAPHGLSFTHAAALFGLNYLAPTTKAELTAAYLSAIRKSQGTIIEIKTNRASNAEYHRELQTKIRKALTKSGKG